MKWLYKGSYLLMLIGFGVIYLTCVDRWHIYGESLAKAEEWYYASRPEKGGKDVPREGADAAKGNSGPESGAAWISGGKENLPPDETDESGMGDSLPENDQEESPSAEPPEGEAASGDEASAVQPDGDGEENPPEGGVGGEPVYVAVEDDYFSDALFIGDSRTVGLFEYGGLEETTTFYAATGLTVYKLFDTEIVSVPGERKKITVEEALSRNSFAKIYLMIGINEMGTGTVETFLAKYQEVVEHLQELQPEAVIYLQAIIKVSAQRSRKGDYINNEGIVARNEGIEQMADNVKVFYLDVNPLICDETGGMIPDYTFDGVHLKAKYIDIWKDYLKSHAILLD